MGKVINYRADLDIRNLGALPAGLGATYLLAIEGPGEVLIAKRWTRNRPTLGPGEVLIDFSPRVDLTEAGEQFVVPGCERKVERKGVQLGLWG